MKEFENINTRSNGSKKEQWLVKQLWVAILVWSLIGLYFFLTK